jgi:NAD-dependent SIR2 family protein deacetylase
MMWLRYWCIECGWETEQVPVTRKIINEEIRKGPPECPRCGTVMIAEITTFKLPKNLKKLLVGE